MGNSNSNSSNLVTYETIPFEVGRFQTYDDFLLFEKIIKTEKIKSDYSLDMNHKYVECYDFKNYYSSKGAVSSKFSELTDNNLSIIIAIKEGNIVYTNIDTLLILFPYNFNITICKKYKRRNDNNGNNGFTNIRENFRRYVNLNLFSQKQLMSLLDSGVFPFVSDDWITENISVVDKDGIKFYEFKYKRYILNKVPDKIVIDNKTIDEISATCTQPSTDAPPNYDSIIKELPSAPPSEADSEEKKN